MSGLVEHTARWARHPQPARVPDTHWSKSGDLHAGVDPAGCDRCAPSVDYHRDGFDPDTLVRIENPTPTLETAPVEPSPAIPPADPARPE